jgi:hypothetical protein
MHQRLIILFLCVSLFIVAGCGGEKRPDGIPALHKTTLTLTQEGKPLADATVNLYPVEGVNKWPAGGITNSQGVLQVKTMTSFDGIPEGKYKVTVTKTETEGTSTAVADDASDAARARPVAASAVKQYYLVEKDYRASNTTPLEIEIKPGKNSKEFEAGKAIRDLIPMRTD